MKILVTGGAGFIGNHLCRFLLNENHQVVCLDNLATGSLKNIKDLTKNKNFEFINHDIVNPFYMDKLDQIYNLACPASPVHYQSNPIKTIKTNSLGVINMLGLAKKTKARILQASTSEIYGDPLEHPQKETYKGNVNSFGPRACFSEDTEVLTEEGFKLFKDLKKKDKILTLNKEGYIEYNRPKELIKQKYKGKLIEFKNSKIDIQVTPNHKMYVRKRGEKKFRMILACEEMNWGRAEMQKSAKWNGKEGSYFYLPKVKNSKFGNILKIKMDDWLEFFGYYITEGCVYLRKRKRCINNKEYNTIDYNVLIAQDKQNVGNWKKIKSCLERLPFNYFDSDDHQFRICNKQLTSYLIKFGKSKEKYIPIEFKNLSKRQLKILLDALILGDGSRDGRSFYTSSIRLAGDIQEILLKLGMAANNSVKDLRKKSCVYNMGILTNKFKDFLTPKYPKKKIINYEGFVYCINVKNHIIYVRRNGKVVFCGNCYDEGKRIAEALMFEYQNQHNVQVRIARIFNTYGPNMLENDGRVVSNFIVQAINNENITIYGKGNQTRSFCYVSDLVLALTKLMNSNCVSPINLGNPEEYTMIQIADKILELTKSKSKMVFKPLPKDDPTKRKPDITLAKKYLNWEPKIKLEEGLKETIKYFQNKK